MPVEHLVAFAQVVLVAVPSAWCSESMGRAPAVTQSEKLAALALTGERVGLVQTELCLGFVVDNRCDRARAYVPLQVFGKDEMITAVDVAVVLDGDVAPASRRVHAQTRSVPGDDAE